MTETDVMVLQGHGADSTCLLPSRGGGHQPQVYTAVGRGDSASALPHNLPFQVCFERALRYLVLVGLFLLNNNNDEQNTDPLTKTWLLQEHVNETSLGEVFTNHMLEKSCRCCSESTRKVRTHETAICTCEGLASTAYNTASLPSSTTWSHGKSELSYKVLPQAFILTCQRKLNGPPVQKQKLRVCERDTILLWVAS